METPFEFDPIDQDPVKEHTQYTMITPSIAVGSLYSPYDEFDVIVNLAFRYEGDGFKRHEITSSEDTRGKTIIKVGLHDLPSEPMDIILPQLIPIVLDKLKTHTTLLIHCQAGISRSGSVAIALLAKLYSLDFKKALELVQSKRTIVKPNDGFYKMVENYLDEK